MEPWLRSWLRGLRWKWFPHRALLAVPSPHTAPIQKDPARASAVLHVGDQVSQDLWPRHCFGSSGDTIEVKFTRTNKTKKLMKGFAPIVKIEG